MHANAVATACATFHRDNTPESFRAIEAEVRRLPDELQPVFWRALASGRVPGTCPGFLRPAVRKVALAAVVHALTCATAALHQGAPDRDADRRTQLAEQAHGLRAAIAEATSDRELAAYQEMLDASVAELKQLEEAYAEEQVQHATRMTDRIEESCNALAAIAHERRAIRARTPRVRTRSRSPRRRSVSRASRASGSRDGPGDSDEDEPPPASLSARRGRSSP